jgi:hypothetical protein
MPDTESEVQIFDPGMVFKEALETLQACLNTVDWGFYELGKELLFRGKVASHLRRQSNAALIKHRARRTRNGFARRMNGKIICRLMGL